MKRSLSEVRKGRGNEGRGDWAVDNLKIIAIPRALQTCCALSLSYAKEFTCRLKPSRPEARALFVSSLMYRLTKGFRPKVHEISTIWFCLESPCAHMYAADRLSA